jgi:hypothetical protein
MPQCIDGFDNLLWFFEISFHMIGSQTLYYKFIKISQQNFNDDDIQNWFR